MMKAIENSTEVKKLRIVEVSVDIEAVSYCINVKC